jgi:3',5'-cyclic AMP phosphodiesterase CpdA
MGYNRAVKKVRLGLGLAVGIAAAGAAFWFFILRGPAYEITFFLTSDTHYGVSRTAAAANEKTVDAMNGFAGTAFPEPVGGVVASPRGVIVLGDLINDASGPDGPRQWAEFIRDFGLTGEGRLGFPVYELPGNHDGGETGLVRRAIKARNPSRPGLSGVSANGVNYSWDWGPVHFVSLGLFAGSDGDRIVSPWGRTMEGEWRLPGHSLEFLVEDLARNVGRSRRPVVLLQHYGWDIWGLGWWSDRERLALADAIRGYNVIAAFWGHTHVVQRVDVGSLPTFCVGSAQTDSRPGVFMVARIRPGRLAAAEWKVGPGEWGEVFEVELGRKAARAGQ